MLKADPFALRMEERLKAAFEWSPGVELVRMPSADAEHCPAQFVRGDQDFASPLDRWRAEVIVRGLDRDDVKRDVAEVLACFRRGIDSVLGGGRSCGVLPLTDFPGITNFYVRIDGRLARVICAYVHREGGFALTIDVLTFDPAAA